MDKIKNFSLNKLTKIVVSYLFLVGTFVGIVFSFTNYIYLEDPYNNLSGPSTTTEFSNNYEFLAEVEKFGKTPSDDEIREYAFNLQENLNYLGFHDALVNVEGENYVSVTLPLYGNSETYTDLFVNETIVALDNFLSGDVEIGFYNESGISLFDQVGNYNVSGIQPNDLPNMIEPGSTKVISDNGYTNLEFIPSKGSKGHNAFTDAFIQLSSIPESSGDGSVEEANSNLMVVWINYDQIYELVKFYDSEGLSSAGSLYSYCAPGNLPGSQYSYNFKKVCEPFLVTAEEITSFSNPNFNEIKISSPIGTLNKNLVQYYQNQFDISSKGFSSDVVRTGWVDHVYSNQQLIFSFIIFALIMLIVFIIIISYYGLSGVIAALSSSIIYLSMFLILFSSSVLFSFALSFSIFAFVMLNTIMNVYILNKFKEKIAITKKTPGKLFNKTIRQSSRVIFVYFFSMLISGLFTYLFGYQQIAMIGIALFISSILFISVLALVFIPLMKYIVSGYDKKLDLKDSDYNYLVGYTGKKTVKINKLEKLLEKNESDNSNFTKVVTVFSSFVAIAFIVIASLLGSGINGFVNYSTDESIDTYRYDVLYDDGRVVTSQNEDLVFGELEDLQFINESQVNLIVDEFSVYSKVEGYKLSVNEDLCDFDSSLLPDSIDGETSYSCKTTRTPSLIVYTSDEISNSNLQSIESELNLGTDTYSFLSINGLYGGDYSFSYALGNIGVVILVLFIIFTIFLLIVARWSGAASSISTLALQILSLFVISFILYLPMNAYFVYAMLMAFIVSSFTKIAYTYQFRKDLNYNKERFKTSEVVKESSLRATKETFIFTLFSYLTLFLGGIVILAIGGVSMLSFGIPLIIASITGFLIDMFILPVLTSKIENSRQNRNIKNWDKDYKNSRKGDVRSEQFSEGINY